MKVTVACKKCGKTFQEWEYRIAKGAGKFCTNSCKLQFKTRQFNCLNCGQVTKVVAARPLAKYCSRACRFSYERDHHPRAAENAPNWKGGISYHYQHYGFQFSRLLAPLIKERDHFACRKCGNTSGLEVHHIDLNQKNQSLFNLLTLCRSCHYWAHHSNKKPA